MIIAAGTPEDIAGNAVSVTGKYLGAMLKPQKKRQSPYIPPPETDRVP